MTTLTVLFQKETGSGAKEVLENFNTKFIIGNSQEMHNFPKETLDDLYDLVHVDGQHDGYGTFFDLEKALKVGRWILVDGYFWTQENLLATTLFINKYKNFIDFSIIIPGYAGEMLIKVRNNLQSSVVISSYKDLQNDYDTEYYTKDCGGYLEFLESQGERLDPRLQNMIKLVNHNPVKHFWPIYW